MMGQNALAGLLTVQAVIRLFHRSSLILVCTVNIITYEQSVPVITVMSVPVASNGMIGVERSDSQFV